MDGTIIISIRTLLKIASYLLALSICRFAFNLDIIGNVLYVYTSG